MPKRNPQDRRAIRLVMALVLAGWTLALGLMAVAVVFWDRPPA